MTLLGGSPTPPTPPSPVTGAYIRNVDLGAYIDTGIAPDSTTKVIVWARNWNPSGGALFGSNDSSSSAFGLSAVRNSNNDGKIYLLYGTTGSPYVFLNDGFTKLSNYHKYEYYQGTLYIDDVQMATASGSFVSNQHSIHLFGQYSYSVDGHSNSFKPIDICAAQIYKGGVLVRDFYAVNTPSVGLYDSATNTLFTNAGSGSFTYGVFDVNAYTPLDYITTSGNSYFLTDVVGTYSLPIVVKFMATGTTKSWFDVIGGRDASNKCQIFTGNTSYSNARLYGILGTASASAIYSSNTTGAVRNKEIVAIKSNNKFSAIYNNAAFGNTITYNVASTYSTGVQLGVGATWYENTSAWGNKFIGKIYYVGFGSQCNLVPAKVNGVAGMYDTYNDVFYSSTSGTDFTAGNEL